MGARLGAGAEIDGDDDLFENEFERGENDGLLGLTDGLEGDTERRALGVNERGALGVNDGREGVGEEGRLKDCDGIDGDRLGLIDGLGPRDWLALDLMASRLAAMPLMAAPRSEPPR